MIPLLITALVLLAVALLPLGVALRYDENGFVAFLKVFFLKFQLFPSKKEKKPKEKKAKKPKADKPKQADDHPKKGGPLALVKGCLPLVKPALQGIRKRLTIRHLELYVVWAASDPADTALTYGYANAVLGAIWPLFHQNFKIRNHSLGIDVDFDAIEPTIYANVELTMNVFQILTLALPLLIKFLIIYRKVNSAPSGKAPPDHPERKTVKKEA